MVVGAADEEAPVGPYRDVVIVLARVHPGQVDPATGLAGGVVAPHMVTVRRLQQHQDAAIRRGIDALFEPIDQRDAVAQRSGRIVADDLAAREHPGLSVRTDSNVARRVGQGSPIQGRRPVFPGLDQAVAVGFGLGEGCCRGGFRGMRLQNRSCAGLGNRRGEGARQAGQRSGVRRWSCGPWENGDEERRAEGASGRNTELGHGSVSITGWLGPLGRMARRSRRELHP